MTEDQIERRVEKMVDHLDRLYLASEMTRDDYDKAVRDLDDWANAKRDAQTKLDEQTKADTDHGVKLGWTEAQVRALRELFDRSPDGSPNLASFEARAQKALMDSCLMIQWCGLWVGIETDGYTHS